MAGKIFINYRRDDLIAAAGRLHDRLAQSFGRKNLFMDVDNIPPGVDFVGYLDAQVADCDVFLAVIGPNWLDTKDDHGQRRIENPEDFVAIEIAAAPGRGIRVIPVLIDGARMPKASELPESLRPLARRNAIEVRNTQFGRDAYVLIEKVREALRGDGSGLGLRWLVAGGAVTLASAGGIAVHFAGLSIPWSSAPSIRADDTATESARLETQGERQATVNVASGGQIFISNMSFLDTTTKSVMSASDAESINEAVEEGINTLAKQEPKNGNENALNTVFWDPNLSRPEKVDEIVNDLMIPNSIEVLIAGEFNQSPDGSVNIRPFVISKATKALKSVEGLVQS
jgi:hypothetical protein